MSQEVDKYLLEQMEKEDEDIILESVGIEEDTIDTIIGFNEETLEYEDDGILFPQPMEV